MPSLRFKPLLSIRSRVALCLFSARLLRGLERCANSAARRKTDPTAIARQVASFVWAIADEVGIPATQSSSSTKEPQSIAALLLEIVEIAGGGGDVIVDRLIDGNDQCFEFNAQTEQYESPILAAVTDPTTMVRCSELVQRQPPQPIPPPRPSLGSAAGLSSFP